MSDLPFDNYDWVKEKNSNRYYELHRLTCGFSNKIALISLVCLLKYSYEKKNNNISFIELINKLSPSSSSDLKEELADICYAFYSEPYDFDNYGIKSAKEVKDRVVEIMNFELPF